MPKFCKNSSCGKLLQPHKDELTLAFNKRDTCNKRCSTIASKEKKKKTGSGQRIPLQSHEVTQNRNSVSK